MADKAPDLDSLLGPYGPLAQKWKGYEVRPGQIRMAKAVERALEGNEVAIIEAGTGIGKTLAYLLPALLSKKKTLVSTGLKNLQDQIHKKDLVFIERHFGGGFTAALVKGRDNYLCLRKFKGGRKRGDLLKTAGLRDQSQAEALALWVDGTQDGDLESLPGALAGDVLKGSLSCPRELCHGQKCGFFDDCFFQRSRRAAQSADLVLANHHLFMADLDVRGGGGGGAVLPEWEAAIFDEAHILEDVATSWFGDTLALKELAAAAKEAAAFFEALNDPHQTAKLAEHFLERQADLGELLAGHYEEDLLYPDHPKRGANNDEIRKLLAALSEMAGTLKMRFPPMEAAEGGGADEPQLLKSRLESLSKSAGHLARADNPAYVYQVDKTRRGEAALSALPIESGLILGERLLESGRPVIMTSATLSAGGDFSFFRRRLGLSEDLEGVSAISIPSPYDYAKRTLLYVPRDVPDPSQDGFQEFFEEQALRILHAARGRTLILFTSNRVLRETARSLKKRRLPWRLLVQEGAASRQELLEAFAGDVHSVLLATASFWQGIDVPGESLSAVIIDRLPFPRPGTPLFEARCDKAKEEGRNAFAELSIPQMVISLRQGVGRLMRTSTDQGLLAVMDTRLLTKGYGAKARRGLPPSPLTSDLAEVERFLRGI